LRAVIETPKGSRNKYRYDPDCDCFELATTLPEGMAFPFDFGFIPSTLGDDGDPFKERGTRWEQNDRLIAVAVPVPDMLRGI
jgi:Inorganic pyrophosphatase